MNSPLELREVRFADCGREIFSVGDNGARLGLRQSSLVEVYVHLVWSTWRRLPMLPPEIRERVYLCLRAEVHRMAGETLAVGGTEDHVHLLVRFPATVSLAAFVKQLKGASSHLVNHATAAPFTFKWQGGYGAFSVSKRLIPRVEDYIARQEEHHRLGTLYRQFEPT